MINKLQSALDGIQTVKARPKVKGELWEWVEVPTGFKLSLPDGQFEIIVRDGNAFRITAVLGKQKYAGVKNSLEEAFKTLDKLLYQKTEDIWTKVNCSIVLAQYQGDLNFAEVETESLEKTKEVLVDSELGNI